LENVGHIIWRHRKLVTGFFVLVCLTTGLVTLFLPREYEATASILEPPEGKGGRALEAFLGQSASPLGLLLQGADGGKARFLGILKSRTMQDDLIRQYELVKVYGVENSYAPMRDARLQLERMTEIRASREGVISIKVWANDAKTAADIANSYVENLDRRNTAMNVSEGGQNRRFLEGRVSEVTKALRDAEDKLRAYQAASKAVVMEGQAKAAIEAAATLEGQIVAAQVQLKTIETFATQSNPDVIRLKQSIDEMQRQLKRMEYGRNPSNSRGGPGGAASDFSVPLGSIPATGLEVSRLIREVKMQETIYGLLMQQLEQEKLTEANDTPSVTILDRAIPAEWHSRPRALLNLAVASFASIIVGISIVLIWEDLVVRRARKRESVA